MNKLLKSISVSVLSALFLAIPALASPVLASANGTTSGEFKLSIPISTVKWGAEGSTHQLASKDVESKYQGMICSVNATSQNQESVHPNNNIIVASGSTSVTLKDVERAGGVLTTAEGKLTLGNKILVSLVIGKDKVFSGGMSVNVTCAEKEIQVCRDGKVITIKESAKKSTDLSAPCPVIKMVEVCRDGKVVTIKETDKKSTDTTAPCPVVVKDTQVCRDGKVITIKESDKKTTDTTAPCPVVVKDVQVCRDGKVMTIKETDKKSTDTTAPCPEVKAAVTQLPNTGIGSIAGIFGATTVLGTVIAQIRARR